MEVGILTLDQVTDNEDEFSTGVLLRDEHQSIRYNSGAIFTARIFFTNMFPIC